MRKKGVRQFPHHRSLLSCKSHQRGLPCHRHWSALGLFPACLANFTDNVTTRLALALAHRPSCISWPTWLATGRYLLPMPGPGFQWKNQNLMWCFGRRKNYSSFMCNWRYTLLAFISKFSNKTLFNQWNLTLNFGLDMVLILIQQYLFACGGI